MTPPPLARPFTGVELDRVSVERKDPAWVTARVADPAGRAVATGRDGVLVSADGGGLLRLSPTPEQLHDPILLGLDRTGAPVFAIDLEHEATRDRPADDGSWDPGQEPAGREMALRDAGLELPRSEAGLAAYAVALLNWHRRHGFCANCGAATDISEAGFSRVCPNCGAHHFPRTDPVAIMTVEYEGQLLLGRRTGWPAGRLSVLAGFISPGESAEEAVVREVQEESGIVCRDPTWVSSQPWPFPASLMLGFHAVSDGGDPRPTDGELDEVDWIDGDRVAAALRGESVGFALPGRVSIAWALIERWAAGRGRP